MVFYEWVIFSKITKTKGGLTFVRKYDSQISKHRHCPSNDPKIMRSAMFCS